MKKRFGIGIPLLAVMAFVVLPAVASASPLLTSPTGTAAAVGTKFKSTTIGQTVMTTSIGNIVCSSGLNTGTLTKNNGTEIEGTVESLTLTGTGVGGDCTSPIGDFKVTTNEGKGTPYCMSAKSTYAKDELRLRGGSCAEAARPITFSADFTSLGITCRYERPTSISATFTTEPEDAMATVSGAELVAEAGNSFSCPTNLKLDTSLTLEKLSETAEPAYVS